MKRNNSEKKADGARKRPKKIGRGGESKVCACSRPAVKKERGGWVCAECLALERKRYGTGTRRTRRRVYYSQYSPHAKYAEWMFRADRGHRTSVVSL